MRTSLVLLLFVFIAVDSLAVLTSARQKPYDYLRTVRGKASCSAGTCPFWQQHGRSFVSLRCYAEQYKDCTCLHRMCYKSCMFTADVCNAEMVSCLKQICPRCTPASEQAMCKTYDGMIDKVAGSFSKFGCYQCCPVHANNNGTNGMNTKPTNLPTNTLPIIQPPNSILNNARPIANRPNNAVPAGPNVPANRPPLQGVPPVNVATNGVNRPMNALPGNGVNRPSNMNPGNAVNRPTNVNSANRPLNANVGNGVNRPVNGNAGIAVNRPLNVNAGNSANRPIIINNMRNPNNGVPQLVRRVSKPTTTRKTAAKRPASNVRVSNIKNNPRPPVRAQNKPQANNNRIKN